MAHQVHSLPWATLCSNFEYRRAQSGPGPQHADLFPCDNKTDLLKSVEYFAQSFQKDLRQHAETHRHKHHTHEEYKQRAKSWTTSIRDPRAEASPDKYAQELCDTRDRLPDEIRRQRNLQLRSLSQGWSAQSEYRKVYPDYFHSSYSRHMHTPLREHLRFIDQWPVPSDPERECWSGRPQVIFQQCEVVKTLFGAAAGMSDEDESLQNQLVDTLFLLVNHPATRFNEYDGLGLCCCNIRTGLRGMMRRVASCFIYFNMLYKYHEQALEASQSASKPHRAQDSSLSTHSNRGVASKASINTHMFAYHTSTDAGKEARRTHFPGRRHDATPLDPWPTYTRLQTYLYVTNSSCRWHEWLAETSFFLPFFFPHEAKSNKRVEADILAKPEKLKTFVKKLWKVLVLYEMVYDETESKRLSQEREQQLASPTSAENSQPDPRQRFDWEREVLDIISEIWANSRPKMIFGKSWVDYELERWPISWT